MAISETEFLRTIAALRDSEERLQAASATGTVTFRWDLQSNLIEWAGDLRQLFGRAGQTAVQPFAGFLESVLPEDRPAVVASYERCAHDGADVALEFRVVSPDGSVQWIDDRAKSHFDDSGAPMYVTGACLNVTSRKQAETQVQQVRAELDRVSELNDEFLATLSHELRTPLSGILGWSQVLRRRPKDDGDLAKGLDAIERNARLQTHLIEELLDMSRITSGKVRLDPQPLQPVLFIEAALESVRPAADAKNIHVERVLDPEAGPVRGDADRLQQVAWNLLSNAVKFTPRNGTVRVFLKRVQSSVEFGVEDTGIGIRPDFLPHLFERFRQGDASTTRQFGGLGLGLPIVKHLVELHGGSLKAESPGEGRGTTVKVMLPVAPYGSVGATIPAGQFEPNNTGIVSANLSGLKVLVVDDQSDARDVTRRVLEDCAADVMTAGSADEALALVEECRPDVIISDIGMPNVDGFELLRRVRVLGSGRGGEVPAVALTALSSPGDRRRSLQAGFLAHVAKPVEPAQLVAIVAQVAGRGIDVTP